LTQATSRPRHIFTKAMAQACLLVAAWSHLVLAVAESTITTQGDEFQIPTLVDAGCNGQTWGEVECEISCSAGYEPDCQEISYSRSCGYTGMGPCTVTGIPSCSQLGQSFVPVVSSGSYGGRGAFFYSDQKCCRCQSSDPITSTVSAVATTTTTTTTTSAERTGRAWEFVGGPFNRACRGRSHTDNSPSYYDVYTGIVASTLADCQDICLQQGSRCKGVEWSTARCEVWHREEGIWAFAEPAKGSFTCMRYGWPAAYLIPIDAGVNRACRGDHPSDNKDEYYIVQEVTHMEDCKARCVAAPVCFGIEYKGRRCEIWIRQIQASREVEGFTCLRFQAPGRLLSSGDEVHV